MATVNGDVPEIVADTYEALGFHARAAMVREGIDPHDGCADETSIDTLSAILNGVPDSKVKNHTDTCWHTHAACLRDKLYRDLEWE